MHKTTSYRIASLIDHDVPKIKQNASPKQVYSHIKSYDVPSILAARAIIDAHPWRQLTISDLASTVGINQIKLKKGFKEVVNKTIHQYRLQVRLALAKRLLQETDFTIKEIAYKTGFLSSDGFANAFRKGHNMSPIKWRNNAFK